MKVNPVGSGSGPDVLYRRPRRDRGSRRNPDVVVAEGNVGAVVAEVRSGVDRVTLGGVGVNIGNYGSDGRRVFDGDGLGKQVREEITGASFGRDRRKPSR